jgi:hypothetical protein
MSRDLLIPASTGPGGAGGGAPLVSALMIGLGAAAALAALPAVAGSAARRRFPIGPSWFVERPDDVRPPFDARSPAHPELTREGLRSSFHVFMPPGTFLALASSPSERAADWTSFEDPLRYVEKMRAGEGRFPVLWLSVTEDPYGGPPFVFQHEGRHRALGALRAGLPAVPVILFLHPVPRIGILYPRASESPIFGPLSQGCPVRIRSQHYGGRGDVAGNPVNPPSLGPVVEVEVIPLDPAGRRLRPARACPGGSAAAEPTTVIPAVEVEDLLLEFREAVHPRAGRYEFRVSFSGQYPSWLHLETSMGIEAIRDVMRKELERRIVSLVVDDLFHRFRWLDRDWWLHIAPFGSTVTLRDTDRPYERLRAAAGRLLPITLPVRGRVFHASGQEGELLQALYSEARERLEELQEIDRLLKEVVADASADLSGDAFWLEFLARRRGVPRALGSSSRAAGEFLSRRGSPARRPIPRSGPHRG